MVSTGQAWYRKELSDGDRILNFNSKPNSAPSLNSFQNKHRYDIGHGTSQHLPFEKQGDGFIKGPIMWNVTILLLMALASFQSTNASVAGNVIDPAGQAIPNVAITAENTAHGYHTYDGHE